MIRKTRAWCPAEIARLREMANAQNGIIDIARELGRSIEATKAQARKSGIGLISAIGRPPRLR